MRKETIQSIMTILALIGGFLIYSYYNYYQRSKNIERLQKFQHENHLAEIFNFNEAHFNVFDNLLGNKAQISIIMIDTSTFIFEGPDTYGITTCIWKDPNDIKTLKYYRLKFNPADVYVTGYDEFMAPMVEQTDTVQRNEIKGNDFYTIKAVNDWMKENKMKIK